MSANFPDDSCNQDLAKVMDRLAAEWRANPPKPYMVECIHCGHKREYETDSKINVRCPQCGSSKVKA